MTDDIFEHEIVPFLFDGVTQGQEHPQFVLLVGQTGAGRSRMVGRLLREAPDGAVVLRAVDLVPFLGDTEGPDAVRTWIRDALTYARDHRASIILEDPFRTAVDAAASLALFNATGFRTRIVALAISSVESRLAAVAGWQRRHAQPGGPATPQGVDAGREAQTIDELLSSTPTSTAVSVIGRDGTGKDVDPGMEPALIWRETRAAELPGRFAAEWISELRRLTESAASTTPRARDSLTRELIALHRLALTDVIPGIPLAEGSSAREQLLARTRRDVARLETPLAAAEPVGADLPRDRGRDPLGL